MTRVKVALGCTASAGEFSGCTGLTGVFTGLFTVDPCGMPGETAPAFGSIHHLILHIYAFCCAVHRLVFIWVLSCHNFKQGG